MSHNICYESYPENVDRKKVKKSLDNYVAHEDWLEGCTGLYRDIRWLDTPIQKNRECAEDLIKVNDDGDYDNLAVRYYVSVHDPNKDHKEYSEKREALARRTNEMYEKYIRLNNEPHYKDAKSTYISCKTCGSKINMPMLIKKSRYSNICPVCGTDLRPKSKLDQIEAAEKAWKKAEKDEEEGKRKLDEKLPKEVRWLIKYEYHT